MNKGDKEICERLKCVRKSLNLNQSLFAESLGIKQGTYSDIENGKSSISETIVLLLKYRYSINDIWLLTGEGEKLLSEIPIKSEIYDLNEIDKLKNIITVLEQEKKSLLELNYKLSDDLIKYLSILKNLQKTMLERYQY